MQKKVFRGIKETNCDVNMVLNRDTFTAIYFPLFFSKIGYQLDWCYTICIFTTDPLYADEGN